MGKMLDEAKKEILTKMCSHNDNDRFDILFSQALIEERLRYLPEKKLYKFRSFEEKNLTALKENSVWLSPANQFADIFDAIINIDLDANVTEIVHWMTSHTVQLTYGLTKYWNEGIGLNQEVTTQEVLEFVDNCLDEAGIINQEKVDQYIACKGVDNVKEVVGELKLAFDKFPELEKNMENTASEWMPKMLKKIDDMRNSMRNSMVTYCMTERKDNHSLWENYADMYQGFCIEYNFEDFQNHRYEDYQNLAYLFPMSYVEERPVFNLLPLISQSLQEIFTGNNSWQTDPKLNAELNMHLLYKKDDYQYEREWRFCRKGTSGRKCYFPFVSALYAGKDINQCNLEKLLDIGKNLEVPVYKQELNVSHNGFSYNKIQEV